MARAPLGERPTELLSLRFPVALNTWTPLRWYLASNEGVLQAIVSVGMSESRGARACEGMSVFGVSNEPCFETYGRARNVVFKRGILNEGLTENGLWSSRCACRNQELRNQRMIFIFR